MGWNSWDSYGTTITEADVRANAKWIAENLKSFGWQYVVIDMEWFAVNPTASGNSKTPQLSMDEFGRYTPDVNRFPSSANGAGFKPLADYVHSLGLKFGLHIVRGIPRQAVEKNLPIADSAFHAADAADTSDACPWNSDNWGLDASKPAAQAYYDSIAKLYASWGADFVKADCIASRPYKGEEIRMLSTALRKTGRPIVLSLSPGAAPLEKVAEMRQYADMWRISDDVWDMWHSDVPYPQGLGDQFPRVAAWAPLTLNPAAGPTPTCSPSATSAPSRLRRAARIQAYPRRTAQLLHPLVHVPLSADVGRESDKERRLDCVAADQPRGARCGPALGGQPRCDNDREDGGLDIKGFFRRWSRRHADVEPLRRSLQPAGFAADSALFVEGSVFP